jgi:two-component system sensor histidine kinase BaeS
LSVASGQPLATRLALVLAGAVLVVLLVAGLVVNGIVNRSFQDQLTAQQQRRVDDAAALIGSLPAGRLRLAVTRLAPAAGGRVSVLDASGQVIASAGRPPAAPNERIEQAVAGDGPAATVVLELPQRALAAADRTFLRVFNIVLIGVGVASVLALILAAGLLSNRLTRPLRGVAEAARRLGAGDLGARASGGPDRESQELAGAFNAMADRLQQSETLRRRAASDMAHDLATPATVLESQLQAMVDGIVPVDRQQLESARASAGALGGVVARLGELIEAESAPLVRQPERVHVAALVAEAQGQAGGSTAAAAAPAPTGGQATDAAVTPAPANAFACSVAAALKRAAPSATEATSFSASALAAAPISAVRVATDSVCPVSSAARLRRTSPCRLSAAWKRSPAAVDAAVRRTPSF